MPVTISFLNLISLFNIFFFPGIYANDISSNEEFDSSAKYQLKGKHLRVLWPNWKGNPKGLSGPLKGKDMLEYLTARFKFTFEFVRMTEEWLEPNNGTEMRGQLTYLLNNEADLLLNVVQPTSERNKHFDLTSGFSFESYSILIPVSDESSLNTMAVIKPFQLSVWLLLMISVFCVIFVFKLIQSGLLRMLDLSTQTNNKNNQKKLIKITNPYLHIFGNLLSQGGSFTVNRLPIRLIAGAWSLAAFVFVQAYTSTLITYIVAPTNRPLISSFNQLTERPDIHLVMKDLGLLEHLLRISDDGSKLVENLKTRENKIKCNLQSECFDLVKPGTKNVYIDGRPFLKDAIKRRFYQTRKCDIEIVDKGLVNSISCAALQKNSPYTSDISTGFTELLENGIFNFWDTWYRPIPPQCAANVEGQAERAAQHTKLSPISLKNLYGAFVILLIGFCLSFVAFIYENISYLIYSKSKIAITV